MAKGIRINKVNLVGKMFFIVTGLKFWDKNYSFEIK